ncbi:hypothetical protein [Paenibacillus dauci]|uniref:hypothetical protein n=1 Tax=Paenibacillus dauci TaxID=1567106 RepID=UPI000619EFFC|nr:hypothetical protein [Paenibacillus dauci]
MNIGEHARSALWLGISFLIFIASLSGAYALFQTSARINEQTYRLTASTDPNIHSTLKIDNPYTCTGAEVRQTIHQIDSLQVDIMVSGTLYPKDLDPDEADVSSIDLDQKYTPAYIRNTEGQLVMLRFT